MRSAALIGVAVAVVVSTVAQLTIDRVHGRFGVVAVSGDRAPQAAGRVADSGLLTVTSDRRVVPLGEVAETVAVAVFVPCEKLARNRLAFGRHALRRGAFYGFDVGAQDGRWCGSVRIASQDKKQKLSGLLLAKGYPVSVEGAT